MSLESEAIDKENQRKEMFQERLKFLNIDDGARNNLRKIKPTIEREMPNILDQFYTKLAKWPNLNGLFSNENHRNSAKNLQVAHWTNIATGEFDRHYQESVNKIGNAHNRIGLEPRWYIGGYCVLLNGVLSTLINEYFPSGRKHEAKRQEFEQVVHAFLKAAMLDMDLAISTYFDAGAEDFENLLRKMTEDFDQNISSFIKELKGSADGLETTSIQLNELASYGQKRADDLKKAAEISSQNVNAVASASEQMSASIKEINTQINQTNQVTTQAVEKGQNAGVAVSELQESSQKVGDIVKLIKDIAEQTNLLALNATIESARAGEAGKGFAVVASEVKTLAGETARATEEISQQIGSIQTSTENTVNVIQDITETVEKINEITLAVTAAMEQQSATIHEIVQNTHSAAEKTSEVTEIANDVTDSSTETQSASTVLSGSSKELAERTETLRGEVEVFLANIKAT